MNAELWLFQTIFQSLRLLFKLLRTRLRFYLFCFRNIAYIPIGMYVHFKTSKAQPIGSGSFKTTLSKLRRRWPRLGIYFGCDPFNREIRLLLSVSSGWIECYRVLDYESRKIPLILKTNIENINQHLLQFFYYCLFGYALKSNIIPSTFFVSWLVYLEKNHLFEILY